MLHLLGLGFTCHVIYHFSWLIYHFRFRRPAYPQVVLWTESGSYILWVSNMYLEFSISRSVGRMFVLYSNDLPYIFWPWVKMVLSLWWKEKRKCLRRTHCNFRKWVNVSCIEGVKWSDKYIAVVESRTSDVQRNERFHHYTQESALFWVPAGGWMNTVPIRKKAKKTWRTASLCPSSSTAKLGIGKGYNFWLYTNKTKPIWPHQIKNLMYGKRNKD